MISLLIALAAGLTTSLLGTRWTITFLRRRGLGQPLHEDLVDLHETRSGTPTMGGLAIIAGVVVAYGASCIYAGGASTTGVAVLAAIVGAGLVGFVDDYIKITSERNVGLRRRAKLLGLALVAGGFPLLLLATTEVHTTLSWTRWDVPGWDVGPFGWWVIAVILIVASSNAVNLTDGLDGLAGGSSAITFAAFTVIAFWCFRHPGLYEVPGALDAAVIATALLGACVGFLWWNAPPAAIFMGDTGSLALGTAMAALALVLNCQLLLAVLGTLYVLEAASSAIQQVVFKVTRRIKGAPIRVFKTAPIHHHFEKVGWKETTIVIRFWIISGMATAVALGLFYADFLSTGLAD